MVKYVRMYVLRRLIRVYTVCSGLSVGIRYAWISETQVWKYLASFQLGATHKGNNLRLPGLNYFYLIAGPFETLQIFRRQLPPCRSCLSLQNGGINVHLKFQFNIFNGCIQLHFRVIDHVMIMFLVSSEIIWKCEHSNMLVLFIERHTCRPNLHFCFYLSFSFLFTVGYVVNEKKRDNISI